MDEDERSRALVVGVCAAVVAFGVLTWLTRRR
jgi:type IV secretory pathway TrbD component